MNPRTEAIAFRIWQYAAPKGWDVTLREIADEIGHSVHVIRAIAVRKGWSSRVRVTNIYRIDFNPMLAGAFDAVTDDDLIGNTSLTP